MENNAHLGWEPEEKKLYSAPVDEPETEDSADAIGEEEELLPEDDDDIEEESFEDDEIEEEPLEGEGADDPNRG